MKEALTVKHVHTELAKVLLTSTLFQMILCPVVDKIAKVSVAQLNQSFPYFVHSLYRIANGPFGGMS